MFEPRWTDNDKKLKTRGRKMNIPHRTTKKKGTLIKEINLTLLQLKRVFMWHKSFLSLIARAQMSQPIISIVFYVPLIRNTRNLSKSRGLRWPVWTAWSIRVGAYSASLFKIIHVHISMHFYKGDNNEKLMKTYGHCLRRKIKS